MAHLVTYLINISFTLCFCLTLYIVIEKLSKYIVYSLLAIINKTQLLINPPPKYNRLKARNWHHKSL